MKNKLKLFKAYCLLNGLLHKYGYPFIDDDGILAVKTLGGKIYSKTDIAYQHSSRTYRNNQHWYYSCVGKLVNISSATCGHTTKCQVGKPNPKCIGGVYSPNKCAVIFLDSKFDLEKFVYNMTFEDMEKLYKMAS